MLITPEFYADRYMNMTAVLPDGTVQRVEIRKYLNTGDVYLAPEKASAREKGAVAEYSRLCSKVAKLIGKKKCPAEFQLDGWPFERKGLQRVYSGKGSPADILDALWLANKAGMVDAVSLQDYTDKFMGVDCNGLVGNYVGKHMPVYAFFEKPYKDIKKIKPGDTIVYYYGQPSKAGQHVALVGEVFSASGNKLDYNIVDSGGPDLGVKIRRHTHTVLKDETGLLYFQGDRRGYYSEGPPKLGQNAWHRFRAPGLTGTIIQVTRDFLAETLVEDEAPKKKR